jgi:hypothetical protein
MKLNIKTIRDQINERAKSLFVAEVTEDWEYGDNMIEEPIVPIDDLFDLGEGSATVNKYNAIILDSRNLFIADIDFGDPRLSCFATVADTDEVLANLASLSELDDDLARNYEGDEVVELASQSYRVYRTHSGCRVICTSISFDRIDSNRGFLGDRLLRWLKADPKYVELCIRQRSYRARLSPKPWRVSDDQPNHVCDLIATIGSGLVHPDLGEQIRLHDELSLPTTAWSILA